MQSSIRVRSSHWGEERTNVIQMGDNVINETNHPDKKQASKQALMVEERTNMLTQKGD